MATSESERLRGVHVLFVDRSPDEHDLFRLRFGALGARVTSLASADAALDVVERNGVDVLVSDITLEGRTGYDLVRALRSLPPDRGGLTPAIAATGWVGPKDRRAVFEAGFDRFVAKPYDAKTLLAAIESLERRIHWLRASRGAYSAAGS